MLAPTQHGQPGCVPVASSAPHEPLAPAERRRRRRRRRREGTRAAGPAARERRLQRQASCHGRVGSLLPSHASPHRPTASPWHSSRQAAGRQPGSAGRRRALQGSQPGTSTYIHNKMLSAPPPTHPPTHPLTHPKNLRGPCSPPSLLVRALPRDAHASSLTVPRVVVPRLHPLAQQLVGLVMREPAVLHACTQEPPHG